jgi:hypothetical protein
VPKNAIGILKVSKEEMDLSACYAKYTRVIDMLSGFNA